MSEKSKNLRKAKRQWQFSLLQLFVATSLVATVAGIFHWDPSGGYLTWLVLLLSAGILAVVLRTKAEIQAQSALWDELDLPEFIRRQQMPFLLLWSCAVVIPASVVFAVGVIITWVCFAFAASLLPPLKNPRLVYTSLDKVLVVTVFLSGSVWALTWLWLTWPKRQNAPEEPAGPSEKKS